jgi:cellobiose-specific phosphotransferase system component IIA
MKKRNLFLSSVLAAVLATGGVALAQAPGVDIDPAKHSNLTEAQRHIQQAYQAIEVAQKDNPDRFGGHAAKAEQLLQEASRELKAGADYADHHK